MTAAAQWLAGEAAGLRPLALGASVEAVKLTVSVVPAPRPGHLLVAIWSDTDRAAPYDARFPAAFWRITAGVGIVLQPAHDGWVFCDACSADWPWEGVSAGDEVPGTLRLVKHDHACACTRPGHFRRVTYEFNGLLHCSACFRQAQLAAEDAARGATSDEMPHVG